MKKLTFTIMPLMALMFLTSGCLEDEDKNCGSDDFNGFQIFSRDFFVKPSEIYWGEVSGIRSFTYNFTFDNICPEENPKVKLGLFLKISNAGSSRPVSAVAGVLTCFGVQATSLPLAPSAGQLIYESSETTIGMQQCFGGKPSATLYPYITLSFNTLGSSQADSLFLLDAVSDVTASIIFKKPK